MYHLVLELSLPGGKVGMMQDDEQFESIDLARTAAENTVLTGLWGGQESMTLISPRVINSVSVVGEIVVPGPGADHPKLQ